MVSSMTFKGVQRDRHGRHGAERIVVQMSAVICATFLPQQQWLYVTSGNAADFPIRL